MRTAFFFLNEVLSYLYKCLYEWRWALMRPNNPKVELLGARTIVTGISAHVAQTVTHMGIGFERVQIAARVQEGIAAVLPMALVSGRAGLG